MQSDGVCGQMVDHACKFCSYRHQPGKCPAYNQQCNVCMEYGHFAKCCPHNKQVLNVSSAYDGYYDYDGDTEQYAEQYSDHDMPQYDMYFMYNHNDLNNMYDAHDGCGQQADPVTQAGDVNLESLEIFMA